MARRVGSLAVERTDYSNRLIFPGLSVPVPDPFVRLEDFTFSAYNSLLPPTGNMVTLIDPNRRQAGWHLDDGSAALLEIELSNCVTARPLADRENAGASLRMAILWGRFSSLLPAGTMRANADAAEARHYRLALHDLLMERDPKFSSFGYRYNWSATMILERFAECAGGRPVARAAWDLAAQLHRSTAAVRGTDRRVRRAHEHLADVDVAHARAVARGVAEGGRPGAETVTSLQGHRAQNAERVI